MNKTLAQFVEWLQDNGLYDDYIDGLIQDFEQEVS